MGGGLYHVLCSKLEYPLPELVHLQLSNDHRLLLGDLLASTVSAAARSGFWHRQRLVARLQANTAEHLQSQDHPRTFLGTHL
jgi:hypothetical protein